MYYFLYGKVCRIESGKHSNLNEMYSQRQKNMNSRQQMQYIPTGSKTDHNSRSKFFYRRLIINSVYSTLQLLEGQHTYQTKGSMRRGTGPPDKHQGEVLGKSLDNDFSGVQETLHIPNGLLSQWTVLWRLPSRQSSLTLL